MDVAAVRAPSAVPASEPTSPVFQTCTAKPTRAQCPRNAGQRRFGAATSSSRGTADNPGDWVRQSNFRSADSKTPGRATASSPSTLGIETAHHPQRRNLPESAFDSGGRRGAEVAATTAKSGRAVWDAATPALHRVQKLPRSPSLFGIQASCRPSGHPFHHFLSIRPCVTPEVAPWALEANSLGVSAPKGLQNLLGLATLNPLRKGDRVAEGA